MRGVSMGSIKCCSIRDIVRLRKMARFWRTLARKSVPADVPAGHLAVTVGSTGRRFVIRASHLNHPVFRRLLDEAYEVHGHNQQGPLALPCDEIVFEELIRTIGRNSNHRNVRHCSSEVAAQEFRLDQWIETRPLLQGFVRRSAW